LGPGWLLCGSIRKRFYVERDCLSVLPIDDDLERVFVCFWKLQTMHIEDRLKLPGSHLWWAVSLKLRVELRPHLLAVSIPQLNFQLVCSIALGGVKAQLKYKR
jgi:hypothetical protein